MKVLRRQSKRTREAVDSVFLHDNDEVNRLIQ